eukprot:TRINITY_DN6210_c0_g1_i1.p1 TRINITY_DN6210_c0_g1~~TRINITY_DN6210_c0_g1_i1.p1  ORF type:complete len:380 (+),score=99.49 TRINITY_DN6210_c0_g1_i1:354-1493(+)
MSNGALDVQLEDGSSFVAPIKQIQLEVDSGKSIHDQSPTHSFIDLNRAGDGLMEIVTEPIFRSSAQAGAFVRQLQSLLRHIGTCDGNMQDGSLRVDVNVSVVAPDGTAGARVEVKNLNSVRHIERAIDYERQRHIEVLTRGDSVQTETRSFDAVTYTTQRMRGKETAWDYRFFPEPDLPPLVISDQWLSDVTANLPELPAATIERLINTCGLSRYDAAVIVNDLDTLAFFQAVLVATPQRNAKRVANWLTTDLFGRLSTAQLTMQQCPVTALQFGSLIDLIEAQKITGPAAKHVLKTMFDGDKRSADDIVRAEGLALVSDDALIRGECEKVLAAHADKVTAYKKGKHGLLGFFVSHVVRATGGRTNPKSIATVLESLLK